MKKYRLIKEYPGSRKLGCIIESDDAGGYDMPDNDDKKCMCFTETSFNPEDFPEFWVKERKGDKYKILTIKCKL